MPKVKYIVFDVEANARRYKTEKPQEIIEIGAVIISNRPLKNSTFSMLVKTNYKLDKFAQKITGIDQDEISDAQKFPIVINEFIKWIGDDYNLVSWGKEDIRFLFQDCKLHNIDTEWIKNYIDLQEEFMKFYELPGDKHPSLDTALEMLNLLKGLESHRALNDAYKASKILVCLMSKTDFQISNPSIEEFNSIAKFNRRKRRYVQYQIKTMRIKNMELTWDNFIKDKPFVNKISEEESTIMKEYFEKQVNELEEE
jgi:DNA polymerase III epsilon subunit-like protein